MSSPLDKVRQLIRDTERQIRQSGQQPRPEQSLAQQSLIEQAGLKPAPPPSPRPAFADALLEVDPITAAHRAQFGPAPRHQYTHPEQYDPALRYHLGMPPAVDPHEEARRMHENIQKNRRP